MKLAKIEQIGDAKPSKIICKKLSVTDYVFEIDNNDIEQVSVSYYFDKINITSFKDGKKDKEYSKNAITIELFGIDSHNREGLISFMLKLSLNELNKLDKKINDISKYVHLGETFIKKPNNEYAENLHFEFQQNNNKDIYKNLSTVNILKLDENIFIIKIAQPNELFTFFKIDFN